MSRPGSNDDPTKRSRRYPRQDLKMQVRLSFADETRALNATVTTANVSIGGIFFDSTFYLKVGQELRIDFDLPDRRKVSAEGMVVRVEKLDEQRHTRSGFAVR